MIRTLKNKPEKFFNDLPDNYIWLEVFDTIGIYAYVGIEIIGNFASFHFEVTEWTHNNLKKMLKDWEQIKEMCVKMGAETLAVSNENTNDKRWPKIIKHFGFDEIRTMLISTQGV